ncbi:DNA-binding LacI/PurR family transcriptional regulator [Evansella vedderi]|uniref:DNA-binding LacI/PurR family transcriptional regulator n=1 Tax=Evansella vedderi TaxID=38282 RepID=A0ABU0A348_9BACI|nr:substrate-binding domain-containing protein [Evansella vedderi]MDQ0256780.1 DNA-binding LacI/PurR family transcriptional regulator [Evansella vedderi]
MQTLRDKPTAIFCYNDLIALDVLKVLRKLNYKVPEDISIVGYDNSHLAEATEINLTTVEHPKKELGEKAAHLLLDVIEGKSEFNGDPYTFKPKLIMRNSTAKPAKPEE